MAKLSKSLGQSIPHQLQYFYMKSAIVALVLLQVITQIASQTPILASHPSTTTITLPVSQIIAQQLYHNTNNGNFTGVPAARWVYISGSDAWPDEFQVNFQSIFYVDCPQVVAQLRITADNNFTAYLNGALVGTGNDWQQLYLFNLQLVCGANNLTVVTFNLHDNSPGALVFAIVQDQATCYQCAQNPSAYYNRNSCRCQCSTRCSCISRFQRYFNYPFCGCRCFSIRPSRPCVPLTLKYFNQQTCACQCIPRLCAPNFYQSPRNCRCVCRPVSCLPGFQQNPLTCECVDYSGGV